MKIINNKKLNELAKKIERYCNIDNLLNIGNIKCISICMMEYDNDDDKKLMEFGKDHWGKNITCFCGYEFLYYSTGSVSQISNILKKELKTID